MSLRPDWSKMITYDDFHNAYYCSGKFHTWWRGAAMHKCPFDVMNYFDIFRTCRPQVIVAVGIQNGADVCAYADMMPDSWIVGIDIDLGQLKHRSPLVTYIQSGATEPSLLATLRHYIGVRSTMVILDDDHSAGHVAKELRMWGDMVSPGQYMICEDGNIGGHPVLPGFGAGPYEALQEFLQERSNEWHRDVEIENRYPITSNPMGYLRKKKPLVLEQMWNLPLAA